MRLLLKHTVLFAVFAAVLSAIPFAGAQTTGSGTVSPQFSFDIAHETDEIVQLNNLQIQSVSVILNAAQDIRYDPSGAIMHVTAVSGTGGCARFDSLESSVSRPCSLAPSRLYHIRVTGQTVLLLRTRARATVYDFAVGDRINVYGFLDTDSSGVDALIMRDLDKPAPPGVERFIQINNASVAYPPLASAPPTTFGIVRGTDPCYDFSAGARSIVPCPLGAQSFEGKLMAAPANISQFPIAYGKYVVNVSASTLIIDTNRNFMKLGSIVAGDAVNVYGKLRSDGVTIDAAIVRDLSAPRASANLAFSAYTDRSHYTPNDSITVTITAQNNSPSVQTLRFSSGCQTSYQIARPTFDAPGLVFDSATNQMCTLALTSVTIPAYASKSWTMTHAPRTYRLSPGTYSITGRVIGHGEASTAFFTVGDATSGALRVIFPNGGETWRIGSTQTIRWSTTNAPSGSWVSLSLSNGHHIAQGLPATGSYSWTIPDMYCSGDVCGFNMEARSDYKIEAALYIGPTLCTGFCPPAPQPTLLAKDASNAPFTISRGTYTSNFSACLPSGIQLSDVVEATSATSKVTVQQRLSSLGAYCRNGSTLVDASGKPIYFYRLTGCWGNPPYNYLEILEQQRREISNLESQYTVIQMTCNSSGIPIP